MNQEMSQEMNTKISAETRDDTDMTTLYDVGVTWQRNELSTHLKTIIGYQEDNTPVMVDLGAKRFGGHGPHMIVQGETGSGSSCVLDDLVVGLSLRYSPERLNFICIDDGAQLMDLQDLQVPHMREHFTLDPVSKVIANEWREHSSILYLREEVDRREKLLNSIRWNHDFASSTDLLTAYRIQHRLDPEIYEPLPDLVIIIKLSRYSFFSSDYIQRFTSQLVPIVRAGRALNMHFVVSLDCWWDSGMDIRDYDGVRISFTTRNSRASRSLFYDDRAINLSLGHFWMSYTSSSGERDYRNGKILSPSSITPDWISLLNTLPATLR